MIPKTCTSATSTQYWDTGSQASCAGLNEIDKWIGYVYTNPGQVQTPAKIQIIDNGDLRLYQKYHYDMLDNTYNYLIIPLSTYYNNKYQSIQLTHTLQQNLPIGTYTLEFREMLLIKSNIVASVGNLANSHFSITMSLKSSNNGNTETIFTYSSSNELRSSAANPLVIRNGNDNFITFNVQSVKVTPTISIRSISNANNQWRSGVKSFKLYMTGCPTKDSNGATVQYKLSTLTDSSGREVCIHPSNFDSNPNCLYFSTTAIASTNPLLYNCQSCPNSYTKVDMDATYKGCNLINYPNVQYYEKTTYQDTSSLVSNKRYALIPRTCASGYYIAEGSLVVPILSGINVISTGKVCLNSLTDPGVVNVNVWTYIGGVYTIFQCKTGYIKTTLIDGKERCVPSDIINLGYQCKNFKSTTSIGNANLFQCNECLISSYKIVNIDSSSFTQTLVPALTGVFKACTKTYFPGAITATAKYISTTIKDASNLNIYVPKTCDSSVSSPAAGKLYVNNIQTTGKACTTQNQYVSSWTVNTAFTAYLIKDCQSTRATISTLEASPNDNICVPNAIYSLSYNCLYFISDSNTYGYICNKCPTGTFQTGGYGLVSIYNTLNVAVKGCTSQPLNSVELYKKPDNLIKDLDQRILLTAAMCGTGSSAGPLVLTQRYAPATATDSSGVTCGVADRWIDTWQWDYTNKYYKANTCVASATPTPRWTAPLPPSLALYFCIPNQLITKSKGCKGWSYDYNKYYIWQCAQCSSTTVTQNLVDLNPLSLTDQSVPTSNLKACTDIILPNVKYYKSTSLLDSSNNNIFTAQTCLNPITSKGALYLQTKNGLVITGTDQSGVACKTVGDPLVNLWTVNNPSAPTDYIQFNCQVSDQVVDGNGNTVCVPSAIISHSYNCLDYIYDSTNGIICNNCPTSPSTYQKVQIDSSANGGKKVYGCTVSKMPNVVKYKDTTLLDLNGKKLLTQATCDLGVSIKSTQELRIVSGASVDTSGYACLPILFDQSFVQIWQIDAAKTGYQVYSCKTALSTKLTVYTALGATTQKCVPLTVTSNSPNCASYQIKDTLVNVLGYQCKNCPTNSDGVAFTLVTMYNTAVVGTLKGCSYFNIPYTSTYSITSSLVDDDGNKILTTRQCSGSRTAASTATLKLTVDSSSDASGVACPSSDLANVLTWKINTAKTDIQPDSCSNGQFFQVTGGSHPQQCVPNDVVAASPGCSGFQKISTYYKCNACPGLGTHTVVSLASITSGGSTIQISGCQLSSQLIPGVEYYKKTSITDDLSSSHLTLLTSATCNPVIASGASLGSLKLVLSASVYDVTGIPCLANDPTIQYWTVQSGAYKVYDCVVGGVVTFDNGQQGCLSDENAYDENCLKYSSATRLCVNCAGGTVKKDVELLDNNGVLKTYDHCLSIATQVLPGCDLYTKDRNVYYCKSGKCLSPTVEIPIGAAANQLACTAFSIFGTQFYGNCLYYIRPHLSDTQLQCAVCTNNAQSAPYCRSLVTTCPASYSVGYVYGQVGYRCGLYGLTQFCNYYTFYDQTNKIFGPCKQCYLGYTIADDLFGNKICVQGNIADCINYDVDGGCRTCKVGQYDPVNKVCPSAAQSLIQNCQDAIIIQNQPRCGVCKSGYTLITEGLLQRECYKTVPNCAYYNRSTKKCANCVQPDFYLANDGSCIRINSDDKCTTFNFKTNFCDRCKQGYAQNSNGRCILVVNCPLGQYKNISGICTVGTKANCQQFLAPFGQCLKCAKNYKFDGSNCVEILDNFKVLDCPPNTTGVTWYQQLGQCKSRQNPCGDLNNDGTCRWCISTDFYLTQAGKCQPVVNVLNNLRQQSLRTQN